MTERLLVFGGTTEAREILERGVPALYSSATDYGAELVEGLPGVESRVGRLDASGMERLIRDEGGKRLAKRDDARSLRELRGQGLGPADIRALVGL